MFCEHLWDARLQVSTAAFFCLKTRARCESGTNPLIRLELPRLLHQYIALVSGANTFVQYIARWSSPFAKSCAMTDSIAMDLSTGVGQHWDIKGRLAFAYGAWTVVDACLPARARFWTYGFAGTPLWPPVVNSAGAKGSLHTLADPSSWFHDFNWRPLRLERASSAWAKFFKMCRSWCGRSLPRSVVGGSTTGTVASSAAWPSKIPQKTMWSNQCQTRTSTPRSLWSFQSLLQDCFLWQPTEALLGWPRS